MKQRVVYLSIAKWLADMAWERDSLDISPVLFSLPATHGTPHHILFGEAV